MLVILELPYADRYKLENIKKPQPNLFLEPFVKSLRIVYNGIEMYTTDIDNLSIFINVI